MIHEWRVREEAPEQAAGCGSRGPRTAGSAAGRAALGLSSEEPCRGAGRSKACARVGRGVVSVCLTVMGEWV